MNESYGRSPKRHQVVAALPPSSIVEQRVGRRVGPALAFLAAITVIGTIGLWFLGQRRWKLVDCFYMTVMTITTVGFGEVLPGFAEVPYARVFVTGLMILGFSSVAYSATTVASAIIEGDLQEALGVRRMEKKIDKLRNHYVVCGVGSTGYYIVDELRGRGEEVCVVEQDPERIVRINEDFPEVACLRGDATDDDVLKRAGLERASGVFAALSQDKDNLFVVMTAREINDRARIVARAIDVKAIKRLKVGGANAIVSPNFLGGRRMASEMLRPQVVAFMDVLTDREVEFDIEEVILAPDSPMIGKTLAEARVRQVADVLVLAVTVNDTYKYNPPPDVGLMPGARLMVLGTSDAVQKLRRAMG
ncbi:MAG: potassium channel protein [Polyangiaceae bacterium]|nr:potassium channel protein [Polyangiaceae bacterium]